MEQQSRSKATTNTTNTTNYQPSDKTTMLNRLSKTSMYHVDANVCDMAKNTNLLFNPGNAAPSAPIQEPASGGASMSTSHMEVLNMRVWDVLLHV
jgi:hypothetical protein